MAGGASKIIADKHDAFFLFLKNSSEIVAPNQKLRNKHGL